MKVSIHGLLRALTKKFGIQCKFYSVSIHGLLRALTMEAMSMQIDLGSFNPRALTSPDGTSWQYNTGDIVSIHGLLRALTWSLAQAKMNKCFNPRALTSPDRG